MTEAETEIKIEDSQSKLEKRRVYARNYYRKLYHTNEEFRENKKSYNRQFNAKLTIRCLKCFRRNKLDELKAMHYEFDENEFVCPECLEINAVEQHKSKRGRPKKEAQPVCILVNPN